MECEGFDRMRKVKVGLVFENGVSHESYFLYDAYVYDHVPHVKEAFELARAAFESHLKEAESRFYQDGDVALAD
jgi:hypothetical protein